MHPLPTIADAVATHARLRPHRLATRDSRRSLTWSQWHARASQLGDALLQRGLASGDRIAIVAYNNVEWMELYVGLARAGLVAVPINFRLTGPEIAYILEHAEAQAVVSGSEFCGTIDGLRDTLAVAPRLWVRLDTGEGALPARGWTDYEALVTSGDAGRAFEAISDRAMCALMYTSGTTGRPKGVVRRHGGSTLIATATALEFGFTPDDTALLVMPLCHANSLYFATSLIHRGGICVVEDRRHFDPEGLLATLAREHVTFTSLVPTHYIMVLALPAEVKARYDVSAVGKLLVSSAPTRPDTKRAILELFRNGRLYELYGSTEAGWVTLLRPDEQLDRLGSVGREWAGSGAIRFLDEQRREVPDGEVGELFSRTSYAFDGYWKAPEKTAEAFEGEWCSVGDMGRRDADGYIWLVDRKSNMIITGGENVYPSEVEAALGAHPQVRDVAVVGVPHEKWGESVLAAVVLHEGACVDAEALRGWSRERLAAFKCPSRIVFLADHEMPRTPTGKILHRILRQRMEQAA